MEVFLDQLTDGPLNQPHVLYGQSDLKNGPGSGKTTPEPATSSERKKFYILSSIFHSLNLVIYFVFSDTV